ncbi:hypothetical protein CO154_00340 [Candidatus Pacearchaeota archaeon CG_4_9_14_3_um_filter_31_7]|nr:MAG: hypothetical protein COU55_00430 [Candidatus Pacearchaeota archaeon CG10_big_fil_rev_8_21_14_0_10_31_59]PIZ81187.1 MAG: hypothetical protein COX99_00365 [Candidatus Pacearchaeota archaeon CG_4_10_14_0_2_um_filter_31_10]PJA70924.1 MAG: hypothetical protein CO154_00340 [Candidatus Pacearchaeota archaeon CG_4_9_14_3_um_filter_31_7]
MRLLLSTNPELPAITDALKTIKLSENLGKSVSGVVVTRVRDDEHELAIKNVQHILERPVICIIPEEDSVRESISLRDAVVNTHSKCESSKAYYRLASMLIGKHYPEEINYKKSFWQILFRR